MKRVLALVLAAMTALWLGLTPAAAVSTPAPVPVQTAIFAGGCFWCMESDMKTIHGVLVVDSGYTGGTTPNPSYKAVQSGKTGYYEAVRVGFDPRQISYRQLVDRYWKLVDPTDVGGQFCDRGSSYRPAVFVDGPNQQKAAEESRAAAARGLRTGKIVTPILPAAAFYMAEPYHRNFAQRNASGYEMYRVGCGRDARLEELWGRGG